MNPALIGVALSAALSLIEFITKSTAHLKQSGELTPAQETDLDAKVAELKKKLEQQLNS